MDDDECFPSETSMSRTDIRVRSLAASTPAKGSSMNKKSGRWARMRAMKVRCFCPPESSVMCRSAYFAMPTVSSDSRTICFSAVPGRLNHPSLPKVP